MKKLELKHNKFNGCYLGKYKIYLVIVHTDTEFDIILEDANENIYYSFTFFIKDGALDDEFYTFKRDKNLLVSNYKDIDVEVMREELGHDVFDSVHNIAKFLAKNGFIS